MLGSMEVFRLARPEWGYFAAGAFFSLLMGFSGPLFPTLVVNPLFDLVIGQKQFALLPEVALKAVGLLTLSITAYYAQNTLFAIGGTKFGQRSRQAVFAAMIYTSTVELLQSGSEFSSGGRTARLGLDLRELENFYTNELPILIGQGLTVLIAFGLLFAQNPSLTTSLILTTIPLALLLVWVSKRIQQAFQTTQNAAERASAAMSESLSRLDVIKAFRLEGQVLAQFLRQNQAQAQASLRRTQWANLSSPIAQLTVGAGIGVLVWLALGQIRDGQMTGVSLTVYLTMLVIVIAPMQLFAFAFSRYAAMRNPVQSIEQAMLLPPELETGTQNTPIDGWRGELSFSAVRARYQKNTDLALDNLSFGVGAGQMVAFVGASGSGKTTLTRVLLRFLEPEAGSICFDGQNIQDFTRQSIRAAIAYVPQQPGLFAGTVADNLKLVSPQATPEELWQVLSDVGLEHEIRTKQGLETPLGEGGLGLSGGQQQRLAIARALLTGAKILVLDEPTAALDSHAEALVKATLERFRGKKTMILIAHRLSTIENADQIFVMRHGRILEQGSHQQLMQLGGFYQALYRSVS
jgi:ABC-type multidrug transport system fused ATPase/permease subunit